VGLAGPLTAHAVPFNPVLDIFVSSPAASAASDLRIATSLSSGNNALGTWSLFLPAGWNVSADNAVTDGDVVARATMSVDTDCNGTTDNYGPFNLVDTPVDPGPDHPVAQWSGQIAPWWTLVITVDQVTGQPFDMSADLTNFSVFHTMCAPQNFIVTILGRSLPNNNVVVSNPSSAGTYVWTGSYASFGGQYITNVNDSVCIGNTCDFDGDGVADVADNCIAWPNAAQNLPPWPIAADDPDCDGFSTAVENPVGTNPFLQCGANAWPADLNNDTYSDIFDITLMTANFAVSVPPGPARQNIAPDPPDGFIDIFDVIRLTGLFSSTCAPCPGDADCDAVVNAADNCPNWPNPLQNLPPWSVPANDPDCDGFTTVVENSAGTNPLAHCGANAWPADLNNDSYSDIFDITLMTANFAVSVPPGPARQNIAPDPPDGFIDIFDITRLTGLFSLRCN
jgi:hypothetical protein